MSQILMSGFSRKCLNARNCCALSSNVVCSRYIPLSYVNKVKANPARSLHQLLNRKGYSYSQVKHVREEIKALSRMLVNSNSRQVSCCGKREYSTQQNPDSSKRKSDSKEDNEKSDGQTDKQQEQKEENAYKSFMMSVALFVGVCIAGIWTQSQNLFLHVLDRYGLLPHNVITIDDFFQHYLTQGRVRFIQIAGMGSNEQVILVTVERSPGDKDVGINSDMRIIKPRQPGEFKKQLDEFETNNNIPASDRIPVRYINTSPFLNKYIVDSQPRGSMGITVASLIFFNAMLINLYIGFNLIKRSYGANTFRQSFKLMMREWEKSGQVAFSTRPNPAQSKQATQEQPKQETKKPDQKPEAESGADNIQNDIFNMIFEDDVNVKRGDRMVKDKISFKDVAGLHEAKIEIMEFVDYIKTPQKFEEVGAKTPLGALLLGPPGCGKTLLAKALAAECGVPFYYAAGSEFLAMIGGVGASRVRSMFKKARKEAPSIIFIDEIDTIGGKRFGGSGDGGGGMPGGGGNSENDQTLNQLLTEMDGMKTEKGVIVLGSTNRPDILDPALLRAGRFDRHIMIDFPTLKERVELFELYLSKLTLKGNKSAYANWLAQMTPGNTGADIANICNEGAIHAASLSQDTVTAKNLEYSVERIISGRKKTQNTVSAAERKVLAYHESGRVLVGWLLEHTDALLKVTIVPRTSSVLGFAQYSPKETKIYTSDQLFDQMCMGLGGVAAENFVFKETTTGSQNDLKEATDSAYKQIMHYGMSKTFGLVSFPTDDELGMKFAPKPFSKKVRAQLDLEARQLVAKAYKHAEKLLMENKDKLDELAKQLLEKETLMVSEVESVLGPSPYGKKHVIDPLTFFEEEVKLEDESHEAHDSKS